MSQQKMIKPKINEAIIVEGRDDESIVSRAIDAMIIVTHGFGIKKETWDLIDKAYKEKGIIIFTDPDHAGEMIRRKIESKYPNAMHANIQRSKAKKDKDIGIENAKIKDIVEAVMSARGSKNDKSISEKERAIEAEPEKICIKDLFELGLFGGEESGIKRERICANLGIGYCNAKGFVKRVNSFGITKKDILEASKID